MTTPLPPLDADSVKQFLDNDTTLSANEYIRRLEATIVIHACLCEQFWEHYPDEYAAWVQQTGAVPHRGNVL